MRIPLLSVFSLALLVACGPDPVPSGELADLPDLGGAETAWTVAGAKAADQAFDNRAVWIKASSQTCGDAGAGWTGVPLFPGSEPGLENFCLLSSTGTPSLPTGNPKTSAYDRLAIVTLSGTTSDRRSSGTPVDFEETTFDQVDPIASFTVPSGEPMPARSRLTFLDTSPTTGTPVIEPAFDAHGPDLATLARAFTTDDSGVSLVDLESELAVGSIVTPSTSGPVFSQPTDSSGQLEGGSIGFQADLARAIVDAVKDWETDTSAGNLVLNLSLGWHPYSDGDKQLSAAEKAVRAALEYASCKDALVLVAAGHEDTPIGKSGRTGAAYPAAWEAFDQPSGSRCASHFGGNERLSSTSTYKPLVYAVGAVDVAHNPIAISRPASMPRLAAPGQQLSATLPVGGFEAGPISGTSTATVVVSSAAAVVRAIRPDLSAHDTMAVIYEGAYEPSSPATADVYNTSAGADNVRYASVCSAVEEACATPGDCLANMGSAQVCASGPATPLELSIAVPTAPLPSNMAEINLFGGGGLGGPLDHTDTCVAPHTFRYFNTNKFTYTNCPIQDKKAAKSLAIVQPMPNEMTCPPCGIQFDLGSGAGIADLLTEVPVQALGNPTITVHFDPASGLEPMHYPVFGMPSQPLAVNHLFVQMPPQSGVVTPIPGVVHNAVGATLDYTLQGFSYSEPLHVQFQ